MQGDRNLACAGVEDAFQCFSEGGFVDIDHDRPRSRRIRPLEASLGIAEGVPFKTFSAVYGRLEGSPGHRLALRVNDPAFQGNPARHLNRLPGYRIRRREKDSSNARGQAGGLHGQSDGTALGIDQAAEMELSGGVCHGPIKKPAPERLFDHEPRLPRPADRPDR